jgi:hypothetical protein
MYVFIFLFFTFSAVLETWLKIHEDLDKFVDPSPSNKAKASATAALAKGSGDGKVYNIASVLNARAELVSGKSNGIEKAKCLVRMAVYVFFLTIHSFFRDLKSKPGVREALTDWWINSPSKDPFAYGAFDFAGFRQLSNEAATWVVRMAMFWSHPSLPKKDRKSPTYVSF